MDAVGNTADGSGTLGAQLPQFDGDIQDGAGTVGLTMTGGNIFTLTGNNTYTGKTTINGQQYGTTGVYFGGISIGSENNLGGNPSLFTADQWSLAGGRLVMTGNVNLTASLTSVSRWEPAVARSKLRQPTRPLPPVTITSSVVPAASPSKGARRTSTVILGSGAEFVHRQNHS